MSLPSLCLSLPQTFQEDWIAESPQAAAAGSTQPQQQQQPTFSQQRAVNRDTNFGPGAHQHQQQQQEAPDIVRPGRLLTTLHAMRQELEVQLVSAGVLTSRGTHCVGSIGGVGWEGGGQVGMVVVGERWWRGLDCAEAGSEGISTMTYSKYLRDSLFDDWRVDVKALLHVGLE